MSENCIEYKNLLQTLQNLDLIVEPLSSVAAGGQRITVKDT
jgi:hypothetical protein